MASRLAIRTYYSLLWSTITPEGLLERLSQEGVKRVAITDRDNLYGLHHLREVAQEYSIEILVGAELTSPLGSLLAFVTSKEGFSNLTRLLSAKKMEEEFDLLASLGEYSGGLIFASLSPAVLKEVAGEVEHLYAGVSPTNFAAVSTARSLTLPLLALDDASLLSKEEVGAERVLRAIGEGTTVGLLQGESGEVLLPLERYLEALSGWPEALANSEAVAQLCSGLPLFEELAFPDYPNSHAELRKRVYSGAEKRYGELSDAILSRLEYELEVITSKGFAPYFLTLSDIVALASRTCGRGSGAASLVAYSLSITNVDPLLHNLYFERFLNKERQDPPDLDVDFAWDERDGVLEATMGLFAEGHCARVANHNRFRRRSALRETLRVYGYTTLPEGTLGEEIVAIASFLEGFPHHLSLHCGGLVVTPKPINHYAPVEYSAEGYPLLGWEKEGCEAAGLVKIDLLGNRSLAVVRDALANLAALGEAIDERCWSPIEDKATQEALARGDSMGVFYLESPAMRQLQIKSQKGDFNHIVIHSSIIRPAANRFIKEYVRRLKGGSWSHLHPRLEELLGETYGIMCYQEDLSKVAIALAGFSEAQGDALRKVITKQRGRRLGQFKELFYAGCLENGIESATIETIWEMMLSFEGYSFCKAHSASYAVLSYQCAYLRVHHPAQFMAAILSNGGGYYHTLAYISESRRMGLETVGPDLNLSHYRYWGRGKEVVVGLMAIGNLSFKGAEAILKERHRGGEFQSLSDFTMRLSLARDDLVALVNGGAFDSLAPSMSRPLQIRSLLTQSRGGHSADGQGELFAAPPLKVTSESHTVTRQEREREFETLGFLRQGHPLSLYPTVPRVRGIDLKEHIGRRIKVVGWPITQKRVYTIHREMMSFTSFEDETALYEVVLFPEVYGRCWHLVVKSLPLLIEGQVVCDEGAISIEAHNFRAIFA